MRKKIKLTDKNYLPRDISWMYFNRRILQEAQRENVPLIDRLCFLGIYSNNLDEFFRVRIATLNRIMEYDDKKFVKEKEETHHLLKQINKLNKEYSSEYEKAIAAVTKGLAENNIFIVNNENLTEEQEAYVKSFFMKEISGFVAPVWLENIKQLGEGTSEEVFLVVRMNKSGKSLWNYVLIPLPVSTCGRFVRLPDEDDKSYLMYLDDVIRTCLPLLFGKLGYVNFSAHAIKITKDAEMEFDNDMRNGVLQKVSKGVKSRKRGLPLRIIYDKEMPRLMQKKVILKLDTDKLDTMLEGGRYHNHKDLMSFPDCGHTELRYPSWKPQLLPELDGSTSIIENIQKKDYLLHVPFQSFDSYIFLLQEAAVNKNVRSIKTTLYRLAKKSKVINALICAARNGKKVTVIIELLARFDEESNINWSKKMQDAGIEVIFGVNNLKVHSKLCHISMTQGSDIACIGTGNFHEGNAKMYTDVLLMTANKAITVEVNSVINFIEKPYTQPKFKELLVSPNDMKSRFIAMINMEIKNKQMGKPAYIKVKVNHITDEDIIEKLYEASANQIPIDLVVRGNCSIIPGILGVSDTITINGIIDRYLEHSRIFIFANGGDERVFIGSADWMPRNLNSRVEVITPVYSPKLKADLIRTVDYGIKDSMQGRIVDGKGTNKLLMKKTTELFRSQEELYKYYKK
ncbi:MAG: RNA degradosome polyphosphate kinase [Rikenellaceae bacterium]